MIWRQKLVRIVDGSTFTTPTPPEHIKGRLHRFTSQARRDDRDAWCRLMRETGATLSQISAALGITIKQVQKAAIRAGYVSSRGSKKRAPRWLNHNGYRLGRPGPAFAVIDAETQNAIIDYAAKHRCTITLAAFRMLEKMRGGLK